MRDHHKRDSSLFSVITVIISLCMITPLIITGAYFYSKLRNNAYNIMEKDIKTSAIDAFSSVDSTFLAVKNTYYSIISDPIINSSLYNNMTDFTTNTDISSGEANDRLTKFMFYCTVWNEKILRSIALFSDKENYSYVDNSKDGTFMDNNSLNAVQVITNQWSGLSESIRGGRRINRIIPSENSLGSLYYIRDFYDYSQAKFRGLVSLQLDEASIMKSFDNFKKYDNAICVIYDNENTILASNIPNIQSHHLESELDGIGIISELMSDNDDYIVEEYALTNLDLSAAVIIPLHPINRQLFKQMRNYLLLFIAFFICIIMIAIFISKYIAKYINILINKMSAVSSGEYDLTLPSYGITEIDSLNIAFCDMSAQIKNLLEKIYTNEVLLKESELKALQAQMNPHFLFNTLLSISWKTRAKGDMESYEMLTALSSLINANICSKDSIFIPIKEELQNVIHYLFIQKARFGDRLTYDIHIPKELENEQILKLSIQPIVENAIVHGIENKIGNGHIQIDVSCNPHQTAHTGPAATLPKNKEITITITDNGIGFQPEDLITQMNSVKSLSDHTSLYQTENRKEASSNNGHHIGLLNTHLRLKYTYGEQFGLLIESKEGYGTIVTLKYLT